MRAWRQIGCMVGVTLSLSVSRAAPAWAAASAWIGDSHAAVRLVSAIDAVGHDRPLQFGLEFRLGAGWHTYWRSPGDAGVAPAFDWSGSDNILSVTPAWPAPRRATLLGLETFTYSDALVMPLSVTVREPGLPVVLRATVDYAACADICVPYSATLDLPLTAGAATPAPEHGVIARYQNRVPRSPAEAGMTIQSIVIDGDTTGTTLRVSLRADPPLRDPDLLVEGIGSASAGKPHAVRGHHNAALTLQVPLRGITPAELTRRPLTLTLIDGERSAEFSTTPTPRFAPGPGAH